MNRYRSNEKRQLKKLFEYQQNYNDPNFLIRKGTKKNVKSHSKWNQFFQNVINTSLPYPEKESKEILENDYYEYVKIVHLVGLFHKEQSYWFREQATRFLIKLYNKWKRIVERLDQEYFLKIWVFENNFLESQLVFAVNNRIDRYANMFEDSKESRSIPFLSSNLQKKISPFDVSLHKEFQGYSQEDLDEMPSKVLLRINKTPIISEGVFEINIKHPVSKNIKYFLDKGILKERKLNDGEPYYIAHIDNVWVLDGK